MMQQSRPERLTSFSSQSIPFQTLADIGFWQKDIVSEDSRIFWQGFFRYHGDFRTEPLFFPVSMDAPVAPTFWGTMKNIYKQQRRWAWGSENVPYILEGFRKDKTIPEEETLVLDVQCDRRISFVGDERAHDLCARLAAALSRREALNESLLSYNLPHITRFIISLSMIGVASSAILSILLLPPRKEKLHHRGLRYLRSSVGPYAVHADHFRRVPGIEAQTRLVLGGKLRLGFG